MENDVNPVLDVPEEDFPAVQTQDDIHTSLKFPLVSKDDFDKCYHVRKLKGKGSSHVYEVCHVATNNLLAAKAMKKLENAEREAKWLCELDNEYIVAMGNIVNPEHAEGGILPTSLADKMSIEVDDGEFTEPMEPFYIIMELCVCTLLDKLVELSCLNKITNEIRQEIGNQLCAGISYMHQNGYTHNDLHINNIYVIISWNDIKIKIGDLAEVSKDHHNKRMNGDLFNLGKIFIQLFHPNPQVFRDDYDKLNVLSKLAKQDAPPEGYPPHVWAMIRELMWEMTPHNDPEQMDEYYDDLGIKHHQKKTKSMVTVSAGEDEHQPIPVICKLMEKYLSFRIQKEDSVETMGLVTGRNQPPETEPQSSRNEVKESIKSTLTGDNTFQTADIKNQTTTGVSRLSVQQNEVRVEETLEDNVAVSSVSANSTQKNITEIESPPSHLTVKSTSDSESVGVAAIQTTCKDG